MKISKTMYLDYIRCNRFASLEEIKKEKENAIVTFTDDISDLQTLENKTKKKDLMKSIQNTLEDDEELEDVPNQKDLIMDEYYKKIEELTAKKIKRMFGGDIIYSEDTFKQKYFQVEKDGFYFFAFLDGYQEDNKNVRVIETKATTSRKFVELIFKLENSKESIFAKSPSGIYYLREELGLEVNDDYYLKVKKLYDRLSDEGKYIYDLAYQRYIVEKNRKEDKEYKYYLAVLNHQYVYDGSKDEMNNNIYSDDIISLFDFTKLTKEYLKIIEIDCDQVIKRLNNMNANPVRLGNHCQRKDSRQCQFYDLCFSEKVPIKNNVFEYYRNRGFKDGKELISTYDAINNGMAHMLDIPYEWLANENHRLQYQVINNKKEYIDKEKIKAAISDLTYPLYHLDFESFPCPLPRFKGEKPYSQSVFQFSLHIERSEGVCDFDKDHYEFLAKSSADEREQLIEKLIEYIEEDKGTVIAYNYGFEKGRMKEMAEIFPKYKEKLMNIVDRTYDLLHILTGNKELFKRLGFNESNFNYYNEELHGSFSIKKVLPLFTDLSYEKLVVSNGNDALLTYAIYDKVSNEEYLINYQNLLEYCKQDTWAMFAVLNGLREKIK